MVRTVFHRWTGLVFVAVQETSLLNRWKKRQFAAKYGAKVYVAANMVNEGNEAGAGEWFRKLCDIGIAAVIVSDPALIMIAATEAPGLEIHLSQPSQCDQLWNFLAFWWSGVMKN